MSLEKDITTIKTLVEAGEASNPGDPIFKAASSDQINKRNANKRKFYWLSYDNYSGEFHLTMLMAATIEDAQDEVSAALGQSDSTDIVCDEDEIKQLKKLINSSGIHEAKINEDEPIFKAASPDQLKKRIELKNANRKPRKEGEDICPHCKSDLREIGVYAAGSMDYTDGIDYIYDRGVWVWGDREYGDAYDTSFNCANCTKKVIAGKDFDLEDTL